MSFDQQVVDTGRHGKMSFQPWQIFTLLFGISAVIIRYFSSFLMTVIVSVAFGGLTEVVSKYLYVWKSSGFKGQKLEQKLNSKKQSLKTLTYCGDWFGHQSSKTTQGY